MAEAGALPPVALTGPVLHDKLAALAARPAALGHLLLTCGFPARAGRAFQAAQNQAPDQPWGRAGLARLAAHRGDHAAARAIWQELCAQFPNHAAPWRAALAGMAAPPPDAENLRARLADDPWDVPALLGLLHAAGAACDTAALRGLLTAYDNTALPCLLPHWLMLQSLARDGAPARAVFARLLAHADEPDIVAQLLQAAPVLFDQPALADITSALAPHRIPPSPPGRLRKCFGIGLSRTGTTSITAALQRLGYHTLHWTNPRTNELIGPADAEGADALTDVPAAAMFEDLAARFPDARFIYTTRGLAGWTASLAAHFRRQHDLADFAALRLALEAGEDFPWGQRYLDIMRPLYGAHATAADAYLHHDAHVRRFFARQPERLLILDIFAGEGWAPLCRFLGQPVPDVPFPHQNARPLDEGG